LRKLNKKDAPVIGSQDEGSWNKESRSREQITGRRNHAIQGTGRRKQGV